MKNFHKSAYAINKFSPDILYPFVTGVQAVRLSDFLTTHPDQTEQDFATFKALSNELYLNQARADNRQTRKNCALTEWAETSGVSLEEELEERQQRRKILEATRKLLQPSALTPIQRRRFLLYFLKGLTIRQIASKEGVHQRAVWDSLQWAQKKLRKMLAE